MEVLDWRILFKVYIHVSNVYFKHLTILLITCISIKVKNFNVRWYYTIPYEIIIATCLTIKLLFWVLCIDQGAFANF